MDYDQQIAQHVDMKTELIGAMAFKKDNYLKELTTFTAEWFEKTTLSALKSDGGKFFELGDEKARELKREIEKLKDKSSELVSEYINKKELWWHEKENDELYYEQNNRLLDEQEKPIRIMFGELGKILIKYGIVKDPSVSSNASSWRYDDYSQSNLKYAAHIKFTDELININNQYIRLIEKAKPINDKIKIIEEKRKRENVELWWQSL